MGPLSMASRRGGAASAGGTQVLNTNAKGRAENSVYTPEGWKNRESQSSCSLSQAQSLEILLPYVYFLLIKDLFKNI